MSDHRFTIFVTGSTAASNASIHRLRHFCSDRLDSDWVLEVVDLIDEPEAAREHAIFVTPCVVMQNGSRTHRLIGDFNDDAAMARELGVASATT